MNYKHLSILEREKIQELLWQKKSLRYIAQTLGRSPSSVSREIKRNLPKERHIYTPRLAQERARTKSKSRGRTDGLKSTEVREYVLKHLKLGWSPEQIAALAETHTGTSISHEAIYQYIYAQVYRKGCGYIKPGKEDLRPYLARARKRRMRKGLQKPQRICKGLLPSIEDRPISVLRRSEVGHWEDDSIVYSPTSLIRLRTTNERVSGIVFIEKTSNRTMKESNRITYKRLGMLPKKYRKTLTRDRGPENMGYVELEKNLGIKCYFAHAYSSWERGSNENLNGLIRRFLPKGTDFSTVSEQQIKDIEYLLNSRPRKRLGWKTPYEVFYEMTGVALGG
jgi:transposase, IS30 family